jgi:S-DNA-T family DNA segregation ATPase FtsK/SpoIIIE
VGIHLILATQRPQANVVTGLIKSNMPCRISFKVSSGMDSRIVLDQKGAELLLGQGDMLYLSPRTSRLTRAQGTMVDDREIRRTVRFLKDVAQQSFEPQLVQLKAPGAAAADDAERDPLFEDAVRIVLETKRGSVSLLQRRLTIGYSRASRLVEEMAAAGIIGEYKGSQAREVVMTVEEWEALQADLANQAPTEYIAEAEPVVEYDPDADRTADVDDATDYVDDADESPEEVAYDEDGDDEEEDDEDEEADDGEEYEYEDEEDEEDGEEEYDEDEEYEYEEEDENDEDDEDDEDEEDR